MLWQDPGNASVCAEKPGSTEAEISLPSNQYSNDMCGEKTSDVKMVACS